LAVSADVNAAAAYGRAALQAVSWWYHFKTVNGILKTYQCRLLVNRGGQWKETEEMFCASDGEKKEDIGVGTSRHAERHGQT
jgi:hypothetical protein